MGFLRCSLLDKYITAHEEDPSSENGATIPKRACRLRLTDGLTVTEIAHRTPGYEAGDLVRLVLALRLALIAKSEDDISNKGDSASILILYCLLLYMKRL